jgi:hypothetical protein
MSAINKLLAEQDARLANLLAIIHEQNETILKLSERNVWLEERYADDHDARHPFNRRSGDIKPSEEKPSGFMENGIKITLPDP